MMHNFYQSPVLMVLGFPLLFAGLLLLVHGVIEFAPRYIRQHRVSYRPIRTVVADALLIVRLAFQRS
ncbi:MAG: hypothetical protein K8R23_12685 [Chthoniobacter sp.]|nr:hypothetical protein [Chthoniobacter sp.]